MDYSGNILSMGEDIGRHNAVDKAIGKMLLRGITRSPEAVLLSPIFHGVSYERLEGFRRASTTC